MKHLFAANQVLSNEHPPIRGNLEGSVRSRGAGDAPVIPAAGVGTSHPGGWRGGARSGLHHCKCWERWYIGPPAPCGILTFCPPPASGFPDRIVIRRDPYPAKEVQPGGPDGRVGGGPWLGWSLRRGPATSGSASPTPITTAREPPLRGKETRGIKAYFCRRVKQHPIAAVDFRLSRERRKCGGLFQPTIRCSKSCNVRSARPAHPQRGDRWQCAQR